MRWFIQRVRRFYRWDPYATGPNLSDVRERLRPLHGLLMNRVIGRPRLYSLPMLILRLLSVICRLIVLLLICCIFLEVLCVHESPFGLLRFELILRVCELYKGVILCPLTLIRVIPHHINYCHMRPNKGLMLKIVRLRFPRYLLGAFSASILGIVLPFRGLKGVLHRSNFMPLVGFRVYPLIFLRYRACRFHVERFDRLQTDSFRGYVPLLGMSVVRPRSPSPPSRSSRKLRLPLPQRRGRIRHRSTTPSYFTSSRPPTT